MFALLWPSLAAAVIAWGKLAGLTFFALLIGETGQSIGEVQPIV
jgi:hypothetical protein